MPKNYFIVGLTCLATGCAGGQWVKENTPPETLQRDYSECQTMGIIQEPQPTTLGNKIGANPDLSGRAIEQCMRGKGYRWVTEKTRGQ
jgi:hypothetical protein